MGQILRLLILGFLSTMVLAALTLAATLWWLRRLNRVDPASATPAPLRWLASPSAAARLHRRLRRAVRAVPAVGSHPTDELARLAAELRREAATADRELVAAERLPPRGRRAARAHALARTELIEETAIRLSGLQGRRAGVARPDQLAAISERVDHLADAHRELDALELGERT